MSQTLSFSWSVWLLFFIAAALGGVLRFWLTNFVSKKLGMALPWGTLLVNCSGALVLGFLAASFVDETVETSLWLITGLGFLGAYTTVSSLSLQSLSLWQAGQHKQALMNLLFNLLLGHVAVALGFWFGLQ